MEGMFHEDLSICERVTEAAWRARGLRARDQELVASLFEDQV
jgi:hypothetical protein